MAVEARPWTMGVLNATPDSFSGDGLSEDAGALVALARRHVDEGAVVLDLGGESTRPEAIAVDEDEELRRVMPALERLVREGSVPISIDTSKPAVAEAALGAGARIVNDVSGLRDPALAEAAARHEAWLVVMDNGWTRPGHGRGGGIVDVAGDELERLVVLAMSRGMPAERILVDPGLGFGKTTEESFELLAALREIRDRLRPHLLLAGPSRKRFTGAPLGLEARDRLEGTLAAVAIAALGGADVIRVHDVEGAERAGWVGAAVGAAARPSRTAYVGLGANLGDARSTLRRAVAALGRVGRVRGASSLWSSGPVGVTDQARFLNAAVALDLPDDGPARTVAKLKWIEMLLGRRPGPRWGPRALDLDLLAFGGGGAESEGEISLPHPRLAERRFALAPLAELAADLRPGGGATVAELLERVAAQDVVRMEGPEWTVSA